jgi:cytochrome P450
VLAHLEVEVARNEVFRRYPGVRLAEEEVRWTQSLPLRGLEKLPARLV